VSLARTRVRQTGLGPLTGGRELGQTASGEPLTPLIQTGQGATSTGGGKFGQGWIGKGSPLGCKKLTILLTVRWTSQLVLSNTGGSPSVLPLVDLPPPKASDGVGMRDVGATAPPGRHIFCKCISDITIFQKSQPNDTLPFKNGGTTLNFFILPFI